MDRNRVAKGGNIALTVALLAEGVDRNQLYGVAPRENPVSPSSRRAWIEIVSLLIFLRKPAVALLAEGVDRNTVLSDCTSPKMVVALLAEGVDRNWMEMPKMRERNGRPPRGGRG